MPQRTGKRGFPTMSDLVKREDEIRRANNRAEARMTRNAAQAGGFESAKKHSMAVRNWEQEQLRQELNNIKIASKRSNLLRLQDPETLRIADPELIEDIEEQKYLASLNEFHQEEELKGYGRKFFGYTSQPGSNKPYFQEMRALKSKYSNVKNYYEYTGPKTIDKATREKLREQKMRNEGVHEKVKSFTTPEKMKVAGYQAPESSASNDGVTTKNEDQKEYDSKDVKAPTDSTQVFVTLSETKPTDTSEVVSYMTMSEERASTKATQQTDNTVKPEAESPTPINKQGLFSRAASKSQLSFSPPGSGSVKTWENGSTTGSSGLNLPLYRTTKPKTTLDMVFDADTYAPDGRLRAVHTLPDFDKSFKEARQARYVRTKHKREIDRELSVNEMFGR